MLQSEMANLSLDGWGGSRIGRRIQALVAIAVVISVSLTTSIFVYNDLTSDLETRKASLEATGYVFASAMAEHIAAHDNQEALKVMRSISRIPGITYAAVLDGKGQVFATLGSAVILDGTALDTNLGLSQAMAIGSFPVAADIIKSGAHVGRLVLIADISDLRTQLLKSVLTSFVVALAAILVGLLAVRRLQRRITVPILSLIDAMRQVRETKDYEARVTPVGNDETAFLVATFNAMIADISDRDRALERQNQMLESTVTERTQQLRLARDAADFANQAKSSFLATMSHEIRTPLNGLMVMAELLAGAGLDSRLQRYAEVIVKSGQSLLIIINDVLDLSKIEAGKLELESIPVDPAEVADDVTSLFWERAHAKGLDLATRVASNVPRSISGDPVRLNQILSNLVSNALKFTEAGQILISVQYDGKHLTYDVTDSGIGISSAKLTSLFAAFSQADQTITRKFGGTGLGLAIAKRLTEAMGGTIHAASELGRGSNFNVRLPVEVVMPPDALVVSVSGLKAGLRIEGMATLSALGTALQSAGYGVETASESLAGCDVVFVSPFLLDKLPAWDGWRQPIICLAPPGESLSGAALASGLIGDILMLPLNQQEVREMLDRLHSGKLRGPSLLGSNKVSSAPVISFIGRHVLVADDNAVNREVIVEVLRRMDITTDTAVDGREAVDAWRRRKPDLIFMDCSMPEMDGFAASREIRAHETIDIAGGHTPIVALTAHVAGTDASAWKNAGMDAYMTKPFTLCAITACLAAQFAGKPAVAHALAAEAYSGSEPVLDEPVLDELRSIGGSTDLFKRVMDLFTGRVPQAVETTEALSRGQDMEALADAVHALKSMCTNIGARRAATACNSLELAVRTGASFHAGNQMAAIIHEVRFAMAEVERLRSAA